MKTPKMAWLPESLAISHTYSPKNSNKHYVLLFPVGRFCHHELYSIETKKTVIKMSILLLLDIYILSVVTFPNFELMTHWI